MDRPDPAVVQVARVHRLALGIKRDAVDAAELRLGGRSAVPREPLLARSRHRRDQAGLRVDLPDALVPGVGDVEVAVGTHPEVVRAVELRLRRGAAVARIALLPGARVRGERPVLLHFPHAVAAHLDDEHGPGLVEVHPERLLEIAGGHEDDLVGGQD